MSSYTKSTNFATKDTLPSGNPLKIVRGTEIDTEFNNIATAVNSKSDSISPTFTGTVTIPTLVATTATVTNLTGTGLTTLNANLLFSGTGLRIQGDFSNATLASRTMFQTSTTNGNTALTAIPNGTSTTANLIAANNSDPTNSAIVSVGAIGATDVRIASSIFGTGTYLPMTFFTGGSERMRIDTSGNVGVGNTPVTKLDVTGIATVRDNSATWNTTPNTNYGLNFQADNTGVCRVTSYSNGGSTSIAFATNAGGAAAVERARITSAGDFQFNSGYGSAATAYGCRAWVNFDGTSGGMRASGNVSSVTRNGTGDYTVTMATAMPDINYVVQAITSPAWPSTSAIPPQMHTTGVGFVEQAPTTTTFRFVTQPFSGGVFDFKYVMVSVFR